MLQTLLRIQLPIGTPNPDDNQPVDLSQPFDLIVFVILPVVIVVLYIIWKRKKKQERNNK